MRPATDINNGKTEASFRTLQFRHQATSDFYFGKVFHFFLPTLFFGFCKPALAIPNLAHLLLPCQQANAYAKSKELNFLTHGGFFKTILAIPKSSTFIFASTMAKINKLNCLPSLIGVLRTLFARVALPPKSAPQAYGNFFNNFSEFFYSFFKLLKLPTTNPNIHSVNSNSVSTKSHLKINILIMYLQSNFYKLNNSNSQLVCIFHLKFIHLIK